MQKLKKIKDGGLANLQVVADFDHTMTKRFYPGGKTGDSTFKVVHTWEGTP